MLNSCPHILGAIEALDNILSRMVGQQRKQSARLRALRLAQSPELLG